MKTTKLTHLLVIAVALTLVSTGCRKRPVGITQIPGSRTGVQDPGTTGIGIGSTAGQPQAVFGTSAPPERPQSGKYDPANCDQDRASLAAHTVHFEFDSSVVLGSEQANVAAAGAYLKANSNTGLLIEGHCDERGTEEYNRSLGERRALALRDAILAGGVEADRVVTVTFGEDRPAAQGHDEAAWRQNRRGEFVVLRPR
jgi:peptidoglycan-associated lipoprotein